MLGAKALEPRAERALIRRRVAVAQNQVHRRPRACRVRAWGAGRRGEQGVGDFLRQHLILVRKYAGARAAGAAGHQDATRREERDLEGVASLHRFLRFSSSTAWFTARAVNAI